MRQQPLQAGVGSVTGTVQGLQGSVTGGSVLTSDLLCISLSCPPQGALDFVGWRMKLGQLIAQAAVLRPVPPSSL